MTRRSVSLALALIALLVTLWPRPVLAACGVTDPGGCVDAAIYSFWYGITSLGWALDRTLLLLAYQLDTLRWWLVDVAFSSAYQALVQIVDPLILPAATTAIILGGLAFLLLPLFGQIHLVNLRHALVWTVLAPLVITISGPLIVQLEQLRSGVGTALFSGVSAIAPGAIFGATSTDMAAATPLYPSNPCGGAPLTRRGDGLRLDDLAAALLWADAEDIHCPDRGGPGADIPDRFYEAAPGGPGYAIDQDVALMNPGNDRSQAVQNIQRGAVRAFLGLLPATLAVLDTLVQLVFALCLVALWLGLPIGLVFVFFSSTAGGVTGLFRRMLSVLQVSWSSSALLGLIAACLLAAAELRNAAAYTGFALGGIALTGYLLTVAVDTLKDCVRTLNDTIAVATGLSITRPFEIAGEAAMTAAGIGAALATGGTATTITAAAAMHQTGSARYAAATALGRIRPVAQLGEVAAAMGWLDDDEVTRGLYAGERSTHGSWRGTRLQLMADAKATDAQGRTMRDRAEERRVEQELARAERPTIIEEVTIFASHGRDVVSYAAGERMADDLQRLGATLPERTRAGWDRVRTAWRDFRAEVEQTSAGPDDLSMGLAAIQALDSRLHPNSRHAALSLDARRRIQYAEPPVTPPPHALTAPRAEVRVARLLMLGYTVHDQGDDTVAFWRMGTPETTTPPSADDERRRLIQAGALLGSVAAYRATPAKNSPAMPTTTHPTAEQTERRHA